MPEFNEQSLSRLLDALRGDQRERWQRGECVTAETYLEEHPSLAGDADSAVALIYSEYCLREELGQSPEPKEYLDRFPQYADRLEPVFEIHQALDSSEVTESAAQGDRNDKFHQAAYPGGHAHGDADETTVGFDSASSFCSNQPQKFGRYTVRQVLGQGTFGTVYLARDNDLKRDVAVKVLHLERLAETTDPEQFLAEARIVASLDHPNIVPVHDVGQTEDGRCFVVSKSIDGSDLRSKMQSARPTHLESAERIVTLAEALHYAHKKGLVHRDIKPANILIDSAGKSYIADLGLALQQSEFGKGSDFLGTPSYMSPEQAQGQSHLVDGRSDIFSLGVVFYELLTSTNPFKADNWEESVSRISTLEARPPRQIDDTIAKELERICLKCLSKQVADRYTTAADLAADLREFLETADRVKITASAQSKSVTQRMREIAVNAHLSKFGCSVSIALASVAAVAIGGSAFWWHGRDWGDFSTVELLSTRDSLDESLPDLASKDGVEVKDPEVAYLMGESIETTTPRHAPDPVDATRPTPLPGASGFHTLEDAVAKLADHIAQNLKSRNQSSVMMGQFSGLPASGGTELIKMLSDKLGEHDITVSRISGMQIRGHFALPHRVDRLTGVIAASIFDEVGEGVGSFRESFEQPLADEVPPGN